MMINQSSMFTPCPASPEDAVRDRLAMSSILRLMASRLWRPPPNPDCAKWIHSHWGMDWDEYFTYIYRLASRSILASDFVLWDTDLWVMAQKGAECLIGTPLAMEDLPDRPLYFYFDRDIKIQGDLLNAGLGVQNPHCLHSVLLCKNGVEEIGGVGLAYVYIFTPSIWSEDPTFEVGNSDEDLVRFGPKVLPAVVPCGAPLETDGAGSIAALHFMCQEFVEAAPTALPRASRRRLAREGQAQIADSPIQIVRLRKVRHQPGNSQIRNAVDWNCKWIVSGHVRRQWYPSLGRHKPRWIPPYMKGPDDKPLKPPPTKVLHVYR